MVEGLTWDCSDEFDATSEQPISFLSDQSFISFPNWISRTGAMVSFKVMKYKKVTSREWLVLLFVWLFGCQKPFIYCFRSQRKT